MATKINVPNLDLGPNYLASFVLDDDYNTFYHSDVPNVQPHWLQVFSYFLTKKPLNIIFKAAKPLT